MKLNENGKMTVYMTGEPNQQYEIEKPPEMSKQGWKELVGLFPNDEKINYDTALMIINDVSSDIMSLCQIRGYCKDTGKDLIGILQLVIVKKLFQIREVQNLIKASEFYKNGEITDLIVD